MADKPAKPRVDREPKKQFNVYLPASLIRRIKHKALDDEIVLSVWVQRALEEYLDRHGEARG
ncbi:MAG TPA: CopG family transcriptional regulator [Nocardioidaceae bacterium]|nr:CopG family transcriptional regulator [Nocardioidaceae bacterium]